MVLLGCRLSLDQEDILTWKNHSQAQVLLLAALSAKWTNNDAIDRAVTNAVEGGQEVCASTDCVHGEGTRGGEGGHHHCYSTCHPLNVLSVQCLHVQFNAYMLST